MTRVVAGSYGGRRLAVPPSQTRPTSEKVREALGSALNALDAITGVSVLDLYAGSGAVAIELLSRGAERAVLVEQNKQAAGIARKNLASVDGSGEVVTSSVISFVGAPASQQFDVVFIDPPYDLPTADVQAVLASLATNNWLAPDAVVVVERRHRDGAIEWPPGIRSYRNKRYGDTTLYYGLAGDAPVDSDS